MVTPEATGHEGKPDSFVYIFSNHEQPQAASIILKPHPYGRTRRRQQRIQREKPPRRDKSKPFNFQLFALSAQHFRCEQEKTSNHVTVLPVPYCSG